MRSRKVSGRIYITIRLQPAIPFKFCRAIIEHKRRTVLSRHPSIVSLITLIPDRITPPKIIPAFFWLFRANITLRPIWSILPELNTSEFFYTNRKRNIINLHFWDID